MTVLALTFLTCLVSAWVPVVNAEAYLGAAATQEVSSWWAIAAAAALGQMTGKVGFFLLGRQSLSWEWMARKMAKLRVDRWVDQMARGAQTRPWVAWAIVFVSAAVGVPPFAIISFLAGQVRVSLTAFLLLGTIGRFLRFATIVLGVETVGDLW